MGKIMGRRNSLSNLINLQRFRHHHKPTEEVKPVHPQDAIKRVRSPSSSTFEDDDDDDESEATISTLPIIPRRHSTGNHSCMASSSLSSTSGTCNATKSVRFGDCQIRSYPQVLGDHPYCSMGCPVELGWEYNKEEFQAINDFEEHRDHQRRRTKGALLLSPEQRRNILSDSNNSDVCAIRKACRRQCTRKAQRKIQREFFSN